MHHIEPNDGVFRNKLILVTSRIPLASDLLNCVITKEPSLRVCGDYIGRCYESDVVSAMRAFLVQVSKGFGGLGERSTRLRAGICILHQVFPSD